MREREREREREGERERQRQTDRQSERERERERRQEEENEIRARQGTLLNPLNPYMPSQTKHSIFLSGEMAFGVPQGKRSCLLLSTGMPLKYQRNQINRQAENIWLLYNSCVQQKQATHTQKGFKKCKNKRSEICFVLQRMALQLKRGYRYTGFDVIK